MFLMGYTVILVEWGKKRWGYGGFLNGPLIIIIVIIDDNLSNPHSHPLSFQ